jgi:hypothetical protein
MKRFSLAVALDHTSVPDPRKMLEQMRKPERKPKPASFTDPASRKPASAASTGLPVAKMANK